MEVEIIEFQNKNKKSRIILGGGGLKVKFQKEITFDFGNIIKFTKETHSRKTGGEGVNAIWTGSR